MFTIVVTPKLMDEEWNYSCDDEEILRSRVTAFNALGVEIVDVLRDDESMSVDEYQKILSECSKIGKEK